MVSAGSRGCPPCRAARRLLALWVALTSASVLAWTYPPTGPYGAPAQGPYQGPFQSPYQGMPQAPYQAPQSPYQGTPGYPYQGAPQSPYYQGPYQMPQGGYQPGTQPPFPAGQYQFRPPQQDNARGTPPVYQPPAAQTPNYYQGYQSGWPNGYGRQAPAASQSKPPRLEWSLSETKPYVQQNLLLRLKLISSDSLTTADPELPADGDVLVQKVAGPTSSTRSVGGDGGREIVTEFDLMLTPLRSGNIEVPALKVTGTRPGPYGGSERYEAIAAKPIRLQVRPPMTSVRPWLPLRSLTLNASFDHGEEVSPGQPVTLILELSAVGAHAAQLPNLEDQLASPDFRVYREQSLTDTSLSSDDRDIVGKRTEYYTLVPQSGGTLRLPEIEVPWWNVDTGMREVATLPIRTLSVDGGVGPFRLPASLIAGGAGWSKVWLPLGAILLVLAGYWVGVLYRGRAPAGISAPDLIARLRSGTAEATRLAEDWARRALQRLHPAPVAASLQGAALGLLPESSRLLLVARQAGQTDSPIAWCNRFEQGARRHLRSCSTGSLPNMTERILVLRPRADRAKFTQLMEQLDSALYGRQDIDFPRWKREFMRQIGRAPALLRRRRAESRIRRAHLPALNPSPL